MVFFCFHIFFWKILTASFAFYTRLIFSFCVCRHRDENMLRNDESPCYKRKLNKNCFRYHLGLRCKFEHTLGNNLIVIPCPVVDRFWISFRKAFKGYSLTLASSYQLVRYPNSRWNWNEIQCYRRVYNINISGSNKNVLFFHHVFRTLLFHCEPNSKTILVQFLFLQPLKKN